MFLYYVCVYNLNIIDYDKERNLDGSDWCYC